ncbi:MAG: tRNA (guanosine(37)-N1)-methyltransferase TrmD [Eubacterium sp.]|nr:tRNA (guanosine(37)-N1)-methyltransferase TrmD [Eubacterium sp.]
MRLSVLTIFPELFDSVRNEPVLCRALDKGIVELEIVDIKKFAGGSFRHIDDSPFGGGAGMILRPGPVLDALDSVRTPESYVAALTPSGRKYDQKTAHSLAACSHLILIAGHYEGFDERIFRHVDALISIGDYILTGGELPALVVIDSVVRLLPGVLRAESTKEESFENGLLEYPQYTQPSDFRGDKVPDVLLSGNHEAIRKWRQKESLRITRERRPDLLPDLLPDLEKTV